MRPSTLLPFVLSAIISPCYSAIYTKYTQLPGDKFDYVIIVVPGNAGLVLANRLSENPSRSVLVLEAGGSDEGVLAAAVPFLGPTLTPNTIYDWNYTVAPQTGLNNRVFPLPRGRVLGGCTTVNYMVHQYGSSDDYEKLAQLAGDATWNWNNVRPGIFVHERIVAPADGHDYSNQYIPANHGTNGIVSVSLPGYSHSIDAKVIAATQQLSAEFPYNPDMGGGENVLGIGWTQASIGNGARSSASNTYLKTANNRPNLHVLINSQVTKLARTGLRNNKPVFGGVHFNNKIGSTSIPRTVFAKKEVIVSAGSIGTPQILLLSGIGSKTDLTRLSISTIINNPSVGANLSDHVLLPNIFNVRGNESLDTLLRDPNVFGAALNQWQTSKTGPLANGVTNQLGFFRLKPQSYAGLPDPSSGPKGAHWEAIVSNFFLNPGVALPASGSFMTVVAALISPTSRGFVKLRSKNPLEPPIIDPKMVTSAWDKIALREAVKAVKRFVAAPAFSDYVLSAWGSTAGTTNAQIDAHVRGLSTTVFHPVGTAAMTSRNAKWGVVDPDLKVKGAEGLRVVDASIWPFLPSAHTQGPTYLIAERAALIIKGQA